MTTLVWLQRDLRLDDQPALRAAAGDDAIVPVFVLAPDDEEGGWPLGAASRWWLHHSLAALDADLRQRGAGLVLRRGPTITALQQLMAATAANRLLFCARPEPAARAREQQVLRAIPSAQALPEPGLVEGPPLRTGSGGPYRVFTPMYRALSARGAPPPPQPAPARLPPLPPLPPLTSVPLEALGLLPRLPWADGLATSWRPGATAALDRLATFAGPPLRAYASTRDLPGVAGTSGMSPHFAFGEASPRRAWHATAGAEGAAFQRQLAWRHFARTLLVHAPALPHEPLDARFAAMPWRDAPAELRAWQRGETGYPIVDAGMRQLWRTGWMHNRVRMIVGSFLVKDLLLPWQAGLRWFHDTLVDADLANNAMGWQWIAGCGADAAPYFRIFDPVAQGQRFDPDGSYVRRWLPELAALDAKHIHEPATAPPAALAAAGVRLGTTYPRPVVDHRSARARALLALATMRERVTRP